MSSTKEQTLQINLGLAADDLFYAYSSSAYSTDEVKWVEKGDYVKAFEEYFNGMGKRATHRVYPPYLGVQKFTSSNLPIPRYNSCENQKTRFTGLAYGYWTEKYNNPNYLYKVPYTRALPPYGCVPRDAPTKVDWSESQFASNRAWATMQPRFEGDFQALNFLYELKDFKNIAKHIAALRPTEIVGTLKKARARIRSARRAVESGTATAKIAEIARCGSRTAAEVVLIKHFAIDPTVKDLLALHSQLMTSVRDAQHRFRDIGQQGNVRHYSEEISRIDGRTMGTGNNYWLRTGYFKKDTFTATMSYSYDYTMRDKMDAFSRLYGFGLNAGVVWNAVPFTFLVDYFVKVGDAIEMMQRDPNVLLQLHQYCESRLVELRDGLMYGGDGRVHCAIINGAVPEVDQLITGYEGSYFQRRVVSPSKGIVLPRVKLPSVKQAVNIAALVRCMM